LIILKITYLFALYLTDLVQLLLPQADFAHGEVPGHDNLPAQVYQGQLRRRLVGFAEGSPVAEHLFGDYHA